MYRTLLPASLVLWFGLLPPAVHAQAKASLQEALALEKAMQHVIEEVEPSVACILVSRSDVYRRWYRDAPAKDSPGKLGGFDAARAVPNPPASERSQLQELQRAVAGKLSFQTPDDIRHELNRRFDLADLAYVPESYGSGVVINQKGLVLTNYHVVRGATKLYIRLPGDKGSYANVYAADPRSDLAVLEVLNRDILPLRAIKRGDGGKIRKGQFVLSIANPFAAGFRDGSPSASWGIVSNVRRRAPAKPLLDEWERSKLTLHHFGTLIQTDARLNLGCSGGALINLQGELIGLTTALAAISGSETAGGFAVPMDDGMRRIIDVLDKGQEIEYGFLGVSFRRENRRREGAELGTVIGNSPAFHADLRPGDAILAVDGMPIRENDDLFLAIGTRLAGGEASLKVRRADGQERTVQVKLAKFYQPEPFIASRKPPASHGLRVDYTSVLFQLRPFPGGDIAPGVYVREVEAGTAAAAAQLENAVITHVNNQPVNNPDEFRQEVERADKTRASLEVTVAGRDGGPARQVKLD